MRQYKANIMFYNTAVFLPSGTGEDKNLTIEIKWVANKKMKEAARIKSWKN